MLASGSAKLFEAGLLHLESELKQIADSTDWERVENQLTDLLASYDGVLGAIEPPTTAFWGVSDLSTLQTRLQNYARAVGTARKVIKTVTENVGDSRAAAIQRKFDVLKQKNQAIFMAFDGRNELLYVGKEALLGLPTPAIPAY